VYTNDFVNDNEVNKKNQDSFEVDNSTGETTPCMAAERDDEALIIDQMEVDFLLSGRLVKEGEKEHTLSSCGTPFER